jgi:hypothetical protein
MPSLVRTIDALTPIVSGIGAYLSDVNRLGSGAPDVLSGEWQTQQNNGPSLVVVGLGGLRYAGAAAEEPGLRSTPSYTWDFGDGFAAPVIGIRNQTFTVWVHWADPNFATADPSTYALNARVQTLALSDLVFAGLRALTDHDFAGQPGQPFGEPRGEFVFGSTVAWSFVIPVPVLGDAYPYQTPAGMTATVLFAGTSPGDTIFT